MNRYRLPTALLATLMALLTGCGSERPAKPDDQLALEALLRQADSFPDRALSVADAAIRMVTERHLPDTAYHAPWMRKARALHSAGEAARARQLIDSSMDVAGTGGHWAAVGRMALLSAPWAAEENDGNPASRTDRVGRYRRAVEAFDKADLPLEKAFALSQLGFYLNLKSTPWAVDTMKLALVLLQKHDGPAGEIISCAHRIGIHSYGLGKPDEGRHYLELAVRLSRTRPDSAQAAPFLRLIAYHLREAKPDSALYFFALADRLDPGILDPINYYRNGRLEASIIRIRKGQWQLARPTLDSCLTFARRENRKPLSARALFHIGQCEALAGNRAEAGRRFRSAEILSDSLNIVPLRLGVIDGYLALARDLGDVPLERRLMAKRAVIDPSAPAPSPSATHTPTPPPVPAAEGPTPSPAPAAGSPATPVAPVEGIPVVRTETSSGWMPQAVAGLLERYPLIPIALPPVLLLAGLTIWLLVRNAQHKRIKLFESYLRLLTEGRDYRHNLHSALLQTGEPGKGANRKQWTMYLLETWLLADKPFRNPAFGPDDCARHLGIDMPLLEEVVQAHVDVDTATYLDHLRVEDSIRQMRDPASKGLSLSAIRQVSGFRSLLAFRSTFRISTGVTPGRYRAFCRAEMRK